MSRGINWGNLRAGALSLVVSGIAAYYAQPLIHDNQEAVNVIVTVFSILAGFLVAIIAILGDAALLPPGTWRAAEMERGRIMARLRRHRLLFFFYLVTLFFVFLAMLVPEEYKQIQMWVERIFLFSGVLAFVMSFFLPISLMRAQIEKIDAFIEHKRKEENISSSDSRE